MQAGCCPICWFMGSCSGGARPSSTSLDLVLVCPEEEIAGYVHIHLEPNCGEADVLRPAVGRTELLVELVAHVPKCIRWSCDALDLPLPNDVHWLGPTGPEGCHSDLAQGSPSHSPCCSSSKLAPARALRYLRSHTQKAVIGAPPKVQA